MRTKEEIIEDMSDVLLDIEDYADSISPDISTVRDILEELKEALI